MENQSIRNLGNKNKAPAPGNKSEKRQVLKMKTNQKRECNCIDYSPAV